MPARKIVVAAIAVVLGLVSGRQVASGGGNLRIGINIVPSCDVHGPERPSVDPSKAIRVSCTARAPYRISHPGEPSAANPPQAPAATTAVAGAESAGRVVTTVVF